MHCFAFASSDLPFLPWSAKEISGDAQEFLAALRWNKNPTRWCSIGNMAAILELAQPESVELIDYRQAYDEQGMLMVSSAAMALL